MYIREFEITNIQPFYFGKIRNDTSF